MRNDADPLPLSQGFVGSPLGEAHSGGDAVSPSNESPYHDDPEFFRSAEHPFGGSARLGSAPRCSPS